MLKSDGSSPAYVYHCVLIKRDIAPGDVFALSVDSYTGVSASNPVNIYLKRENGTNVRNTFGQTSCSISVTQSDIDNGAVYADFTLYPAQGTGPLSNAAVFYNVKALEGGVIENNKLGNIISDAIDHVYTSTVILDKSSVVVSGTGRFAYQDFYIAQNIEAGDYFEFSCESVTGNTSSTSLFIYVDEPGEPSTHIRNIMGNGKISVKVTENDILSGATQIRFRLYAATGTPMPTGAATYANVMLKTAANPFSVGDYMQTMLYDASPLISETVKTIAHRGDDVYAPQCVEAAYTTARKHRHTIAENDLCVTVDGVYVMWHDTSFVKLGTYIFDVNGYFLYTDGTDYYWYDSTNDVLYDESYTVSSASVSNLTQCAGASYGVANYGDVIGLPHDVLKNVDAGAYKGFAGQRIMTFAEWVLLCKQLGMEIYVDKKISYTTAIINDIFTIVNRLGMKDKTSWIISTLAEADALRALDQNARLLTLNNPTEGLISTWSSYNTGRGFAFNGDGKQTTQAQVQLGLDAGFEVECWYVDVSNVSEENQFNRIRELVSYGVTGLTLDHYRVDEAFMYMFE